MQGSFFEENTVTRKERYRTDPEYRAKVIADVKELHEFNKQLPQYRRLVKCRKQIYNLRRGIEVHLHKVELLERRIFAHLKRKEILEHEYHISKAKINAGTAGIHRGVIH